MAQPIRLIFHLTCRFRNLEKGISLQDGPAERLTIARTKWKPKTQTSDKQNTAINTIIAIISPSSPSSLIQSSPSSRHHRHHLSSNHRHHLASIAIIATISPSSRHHLSSNHRHHPAIISPSSPSLHQRRFSMVCVCWLFREVLWMRARGGVFLVSVVVCWGFGVCVFVLRFSGLCCLCSC